MQPVLWGRVHSRKRQGLKGVQVETMPKELVMGGALHVSLPHWDIGIAVVRPLIVHH